MNINGNYNVYSLYNTLYQGNMSVFNNRLNRTLFQNKAQGSQSLGTSTLQYVNNIKTASKDLSSALKELSGAAFSNRTLASSDPDVMTVKYSGNQPSSVNPITVKIDQTAAGQMNEGARMSANATFEGSSGTNKFKIETGGKSNEFSVKTTAGDTNKDIQQKMADAINKAGIGVKATVEIDSATNSSILKLESTNTGSNPKNGFTVTDIIGNLAAKTGANDVAREGQDAIYSVNGGPVRTAQSNTVNLGNGVSATLKQPSGEAVTISRGKNIDSAKSAVEDMAKIYNNLYTEAAARTDDPKSQSLASKMASISKIYSGSLSNIGIGFDSSGRMTINAQKMNEAAEGGKLEKFFTESSGKNYGFTNQLSRLSDSVSHNTSNFVSSSLFGSSLSENFAYSNYGNLIQYNYLGTGSIFDYLY